MTREEIRSEIERAATALMEGDAEALASMFAEDGVFIVPGSQWRGPEEIGKVIGEMASELEVKIEIRQMVVEGDRAVVEWHWRQRNKKTGETKTAEDAIAIDFQDGKIARWREYIDWKSTPT